jgi:hypothetical protein
MLTAKRFTGSRTHARVKLSAISLGAFRVLRMLTGTNACLLGRYLA